MAVKEGGDSNFAATELLADGLEAQPLFGLSVEEGLGVGGKAINDRALSLISAWGVEIPTDNRVPYVERG